MSIIPSPCHEEDREEPNCVRAGGGEADNVSFPADGWPPR